MHRHQLSVPFLIFAGLSVLTVNCIADDKELWIEQMQCGEIRYEIESDCKKSTEPDTLNECKSQQLRITHDGNTRMEALPRFEKSSAKGIREAGRSVNDFFVTQWACVDGGAHKVAVLYYSVGGGTGAYVDAATVYGAEGILIEDEESATVRIAMANLGRMRAVKSIMPD